MDFRMLASFLAPFLMQLPGVRTGMNCENKNLNVIWQGIKSLLIPLVPFWTFFLMSEWRGQLLIPGIYYEQKCSLLRYVLTWTLDFV